MADKLLTEMFKKKPNKLLLSLRRSNFCLFCISHISFQELTGHLPAEIPLAPGEQPPQIRRRVGTAFSLNTSVVPGGDKKEVLIFP